MSIKKQLLLKYQVYPLTHQYLSKWMADTERALFQEADFLNEEWSDIGILEENMAELLEVFPFYCQFPPSYFFEKATNSKLFKTLKGWIIPFEELENSVDVLVQKYPELNKDQLLLITSLYLNLKCTSEVFQIICFYHPEIKFDIKNYYENLKRRLKETPNNIEKSTAQIADFTIGMIGEVFSRENPSIPKDRLYTLENPLDSQKTSAKSITDNFFMSFLLVFQRLLGNEEGARMLFSYLPGGKQREILRMIPLHQLKKYNQRELYRDLFVYLSVFAKDEKLYDARGYEQAFESAGDKVEFPYISYKDYMENKAKIIFGLT